MVVGYRQQRGVVFLDTGKQLLENAALVIGVEVPCCFIGKDQFRPGEQRPRSVRQPGLFSGAPAPGDDDDPGPGDPDSYLPNHARSWLVGYV